jgi:lipoprotein-anchoring transpeptidase ErfK/SrfK
MAPGSILVQTKQRRLFYVLPDGQAIMYPVGVGKQGYTWKGTNRVSRKAEWPSWRPPKAMIRRELAKGRVLPDYMDGGLQNPLGARALYIGSTEYRIHGTTQPWSIGRAVSSGCIRMLNEHVIDLYSRVEVGARVVVE